MSGFSGVIIGLFLRPSDARKLAMQGGEKPNELHITLAYLGDKSELDVTALDILPSLTDVIASQIPPLDMQVSGVGRFNTTATERQAFYASVNGHGLQEMRAYIVAMLASFGVPYHNDFAFHPHITLDYVDASAPTPSYTPPPLTLHFDALTLAIAGERHDYVLRG